MCYNGTPVVTSTNKIVTKTEKITANYTYNLKVEESTITFTVGGTSYTAKTTNGSITWNEFISGRTDFHEGEVNCVYYENKVVVYNNSNVLITDNIVSGGVYTLKGNVPGKVT